jgi:diguanylate cyclase (GGDEF)-like protein
MYAEVGLLPTDREDTSPVGRVLIADDDADFRRILVRRAERMGLAVVEAQDGEKAIRALEEDTFDIILIDLYMPKRNGLEVVHAGLEIDPDIQAIIVTGGASIETAVEALRSGVYDYLTKPLESLTDLELTLNRALAHRHLIRENERLFAEVQQLAVTDSLTGLYNRRKLDDSLPVEVERARRYNRPLSLIMIDLDGLKKVNDTFGHGAGDVVLKLISEAILSQVRTVDLPTRYGGDEFLIVLPEADQDAALHVARRVNAKVAKTRYRGERVTISAGVAQWNPKCTTAGDFLSMVDEAMYYAKRQGGGKIHVLNVGQEHRTAP